MIQCQYVVLLPLEMLYINSKQVAKTSVLFKKKILKCCFAGMLDDICTSLVWVRQTLLLGRCAFKSKRIQFQHYQTGWTFTCTVFCLTVKGKKTFMAITFFYVRRNAEIKIWFNVMFLFLLEFLLTFLKFLIMQMDREWWSVVSDEEKGKSTIHSDLRGLLWLPVQVAWQVSFCAWISAVLARELTS